jgi:formylglycine-generating enzyme
MPEPQIRYVTTADGVGAPPEMSLIPAGEFTMGNDSGREDERPAHRASLRAFRAAVAPVTNAEYSHFVRATDAVPPRFAGDARFSAGEQPVVGVSWFEAVAYCAWLASLTGTRYRLPTEAERERAARGGSGGDWPWDGEGLETHPRYEEIARLDRPHAPSAACANAFGLWCVAENVHEWCSDWYDERYYHASPRVCPAGPTSGRRRASRGGSWRHAIKFTRVSARSSIDPSFRYNDYGFRVYADA